jgi:hypothetical protein
MLRVGRTIPLAVSDDEEGFGGSRLKTFFTSLPGILTGSAALVTAVVALAGLFLTRGGDEDASNPGVLTASAQNPQPQVEFLSPQPGRVPFKTPVTIRYSHVSQDADLWLIEHADMYYPHPDCPGEHSTVERPPGKESGTWSSTIEIGTENSRPGDAYDLLVLLTSRQASQLLSEQISGWCTMAWPGISKLPEENSGVKATVSIFR